MDPLTSFPSSSSSSSSSKPVDLSIVDFDWVSSCQDVTLLASVIQQLEQEWYPDLLSAAKARVKTLTPKARPAAPTTTPAEKHRASIHPDSAASFSELLAFVGEVKQRERTLIQEINTNSNTHTHRETTINPIRGTVSSSRSSTSAVRQLSHSLSPLRSEELRLACFCEKSKGNECYRSKEYDQALQFYNQASQLSVTPDWAIQTNIAMTYIKLHEYCAAIDVCDKVIHSNPSVMKAFWRRAQAREALGRYTAAIQDYQQAIQLCVDDEQRKMINKDYHRCKDNNRETETKCKEESDEKQQPQTQTKTQQAILQMKKMQIVADEDDDDEDHADDSSDRKKFPSSNNNSVYQSRSGMTIEVVDDFDSKSNAASSLPIPTTYLQLERRLCNLCKSLESRSVYLLSIPPSAYSSLLGNTAQLSPSLLAIVVEVCHLKMVHEKGLLLVEALTCNPRFSLCLSLLHQKETRQQLNQFASSLAERAEQLNISRERIQRLAEKWRNH